MISFIIDKLRLFKKKRVRSQYSRENMALTSQIPLRIHLGCGSQHWDGWVNIDVSSNSAADIVLDFREIKNIFEIQTVEEIVMIHSVGYLRLWEARNLFHDIFSLLKIGGKYTMEFPDIVKCSTYLLKNENNIAEYLEGVRGIYAFDMNQIKNKEKFGTYLFGWSAWHIQKELHEAGFTSVKIKNPETHGQLFWRDTRIEAIK